jgi:type I restriction enzyme, S subunit
MKGWVDRKLQDLCIRVVSGGTPLRAVAEYYENGVIPWLKTGEVKKGVIYETEEKISEKGLQGSAAKLIPANSVIVAMYGDGDTAGNVAVNKIPLATNQACCNFVIDPRKAHYKFVYYYLKGSYSNLINLKLGGSQQNLNAATLKSFPLIVPEPKLQQKIAAILSVYDDLIENNKRRIALLEKMAEEIYREWFVRMRFPGHVKVKFEKGVPEGWKIDIISNLGKVITGKTPSTSIAKYHHGNYLFIKTPDMHDNMFVYDSEEKLTEDGIRSQPSQTIPENSISVSCIGTGGIVAITTCTCQTNQQINSVVLNIKSDLEWAFFAIRGLKETINLFGATGATMTNLSKGKFSSLKVLLPSDTLRKQFHNHVEPMFSQIKCMLQYTVKLSKLKDMLLSRLISGKLSVENLDIQFPPSVRDETKISKKEAVCA